MGVLKVKRDTLVYIVTPGNIASGGPEALHQLHYYLKKCRYKSYICYYGENKVHPNYYIYHPDVLEISQIIDEEQHIVIVPEINTKILNHFKKLQKCIWWLGVQLYDGFETFPIGCVPTLRQKIRIILPNNFWRIRQKIKNVMSYNREVKGPYIPSVSTVHLCGSKFAFDYVSRLFKNVYMFVEPLSLPFTQLDQPNLCVNGRNDVIVYNPAKPSDIMTKLLQRNDLKFVPLEGLDYQGIVDLFRRSKMYIDFGFFGGPERIPKEAVLNGTLLLVGKRNAAYNDFDIAIPEEFKIVDYNNEELVVQKIKFMLANYENKIGAFKVFRNKIAKLEPEFMKSIEKVFLRLDD